MGLQLVIGNKNYSSWSMRAWLLLKHLGVPFEEITVSLYRPASRSQVRKLGGQTGLVPVLIADGAPIWDTLAITEYLFEDYPAVWPRDRFVRARARSYAGEVHSSLNSMRAAMPVNTRGRHRKAERTEAVESDIARVVAIWETAGVCREGPWLGGAFSAVDIMFAPVAARFQTYDVTVSATADRYMVQLLSHPLVVEWLRFGADETEVIEQFELPQRV